jgi:serine/threonine protein kinase
VEEQRDGGIRMLAGRYELGERLGRGGMGTVWRARDLMLEREVAVKELTVSHLPEEDRAILQSRMKLEARAAARIKHAGVITIHDVLEQDGRPWIVMELIDGRSLADVIAHDGPLGPREAAEVGAQVLDALHKGHQLGVLHRDVKPANVLLEHGTGRAVLLDFGIAKLDFGIAEFEGSAELTRPGDLVGSPDYLAPERAHGERPGAASDLWGLGATLYAAVEGQSPFRRQSPVSTLAAVISDPLPEPRNAGALGPVLAALMAKEPERRPSAEDALRMLREVTAGHTIKTAAVPHGQAQRTPTQTVPVVDRRPAAETASASVQVPLAVPTAPTEVQPPAAPQSTAVPAAPASRRRSATRVGLAGLAAALLGGTAALSVVRYGSASPSLPATTARSTATPSTSAPSGTSATPSAPASVPPGYQLFKDGSGFTIELPQWLADQGPGYHTTSRKFAGRGLTLLVDWKSPAGGSALADWQASDARGLRNFTHYQRIQVTGTTYRQWTNAADWEWTFISSGTRMHSLNRAFVVDHGKYGYALLWTANDADWDSPDFTTARRTGFDTFQPGP